MIHYVTGDATQPIGDGVKIIAHVCNDVGVWGAGFVLAISKRWPEPQRDYFDWPKRRDFALGEIRVMSVEPDLYICNMIAQSGVGGSVPPIRYEALKACLKKLAVIADELKSSIHMPRIGCGLAGGKWTKVEPIIKQALFGISVTVYDLPKGAR